MHVTTRNVLAAIAGKRDKKLAAAIEMSHKPNDITSAFATAGLLACGYSDTKPVAAGHYVWLRNGFSTYWEQDLPRLIEVADYYYRGIEWGCFTNRPFELFILNEWASNFFSLRNYSRNMLLDDCKSWSPFLYELIIDTCNFILRGRRDINIVMLRSMAIDYNRALKNDKDVPFPELNVQRRFEWSEIENMTSQEFFNAWTKQRGGIGDLITAHQIMFGDAVW